MNSKVLLVTGANRGIGRAIVEGLARQSVDTILLGCRDLSAGTEVANQIGQNVEAVELDLSDRQTLSMHIEGIKQRYPRVDVLINNAAVLNDGKFLDISDDKFDQTIRVNVVAVYELIRAFVPAMIKNDYGRIVNLSSGWGSFDSGLTGPFSYSVSKAALNALTLTLARELPPNVKVNSMCPGWVRTRMGGEKASRSPEQGAETAIWLANLDNDGPSGGFYRDKQLIAW